MAEERVVLINEQDEVLGTMEKMEAHIKGALHRAFSVFLFNNNGDMLLQQRAASKYHSPLLWTNACCSHPRLNETYEQAAHRRLEEELGIDTKLTETLDFIYKSDVGQGLIEHELDHVFTGRYEGPFQLNAEEVAQIKYVNLEELKKDIKTNPGQYTEWFKIIFDRVYDYIKTK